MKKFTTLLATALCLFSMSANAQYYFNEKINANTNPGGLNTDPEQPFGATGVTAGDGYNVVITNGSLAIDWSSVQTIPFSFDFNGTAQTQYKVSSTGVLTFSTAATAVPGQNNVSLPDASIPDNSVMAWGLLPNGPNDGVISKTFGTAPNRQHWVIFASYSAPLNSGSHWTYWGIVLEETTNKMYVVDQRNYQTTLSLTVGVQIDANTAVEIPGSPNITSNTQNGGSVSDPSDNSYYEFVPGTRQADDAGVSSINLDNIVSNATPITISGELFNEGSATLTSVDVNWSDNGGASVNTTNLTGLNLITGASTNFTHTVDWNPSAGSFVDLQVWTSNPNGNTDGNPLNDTAATQVFVNLGNSVARNSVFEQFTTSVCQFCPDGAWIASQIEDNVSGAITTSVHSCFSTDNMTNSDAAELCATLGVGAAPTGMVDRKLFAGENAVAFGRVQGYPNWQGSAWTTRVQSQIADGSPANIIISGSYESNTRQLAANVEVSFSDYILPGSDVRISLQIIEDSVTGSGPGWDQVNFYNGQTGHPFAGRGNPIQNYPHRRVLRGILPVGSTYGASGTVPQNYQLNTAYTESFTYTVPQNFDESRMYLVATVNYFGDDDISQYEILNASRIKMDQITSNKEIQLDVNSLNIYPNPTELPFTNLEFNLSANNRIEARIIDVTGKEVGYEDFGVMSAGNQRVQLNTQNLENGFYFVNLRVGDQQVSRKISILK